MVDLSDDAIAQTLQLDTIDNFFQSMTNRCPIDGLDIDCFR